MKQIVFDIEANGLDPDTVWCIIAYEREAKEYIEWSKEDLHLFKDWIKEQDELEVIGHNIIGYDIPVLERLLDVDFSKCKVTDTLVMSRLAEPSRLGGHGLENWGQLLNQPKGEHSDWLNFSQDMVEYCKQDVRVNELVYQRLLRDLRDFGTESLVLEGQVQGIISKQIKNGWLVDQGKAFVLLAELKERKMDLEDKVHEKFKPLPTFIKEITPKVKKDGSYSIVGLKFMGEQWETAVAPFSRLDYPEFNLGSRQQIGRYLKYFGWEPETFTEKGQPIVDEGVLNKVKGIPEAELIGQYLMVQKRIAQIQRSERGR
jgi:DNA polymerase-1